MSEANAPFNRPNPAKSANSPDSGQQDAFTNPFGEIPEVESEAEPKAETSVQPTQFDPDVWDQDVTDNSVLQNSSESLSGQISDRPSASSTHSVTIAPGVENWLNSSESTNLADLISLIQELNQCNSILLDRVSQLEEALERSQNALKSEVKRSQNQTLTDYNPGLTAAQDLAAAQEQAIDLYNQLEFVHQTSQRQQILIETLTGQLETSQERMAQLEREAALVQQRYNEQTQLLGQSESNCRDLQARLHRQQRYTLQFKVALEKSLDVSTPHYESVAEMGVASAIDGSCLPKVQPIEPWTSPVDISSARFPWMKLSSEPFQDTPLSVQPEAESIAQTEMPFAAADLPVVKSRRSKLAAIKLPGFQPDAPAPVAAVNPNLNPATPESADLAAIPDEKLMQKLDAMVQPLADLLAEAVLTEVNSISLSETSGMAAPAMDSATTAAISHPTHTTDATDADDLLNSVMADAEDALWQDLARLIDVSTEDVVKASLSGDLSAFESIDFNALQSVQPAPPQTASRFQQTDTPAVASPPSTAAVFLTEPDQPIADEPTNPYPEVTTNPASVFGANPGWPAPLVYPTRPAQKRRSLAAVDLPSFLQQQPGPLPT